MTRTKFNNTINEPLATGTKLYNPKSPSQTIVVTATGDRNEFDEKVYKFKILSHIDEQGWKMPEIVTTKRYTIQDMKDANLTIHKPKEIEA